MADFEYVDVNGRQIRVRPRETAQEIDEYGNFHRQPNRFTEGFGEGKNPVEKTDIFFSGQKDATGPIGQRSQESFLDLRMQ